MKIVCHCLIAFFLTALLAGCTGHSHNGHDHDHDHDNSPSSTPTAAHQEHEGHHHTAPHGGALVVLGEEFAHLEFVLVADSGTLTAYVLDGEADKAIRLPGGTLELTFEDGSKLVLEPVADELTGETLEETSTFRGQAAALKGVEKFEATLAAVTVKGQSFQDVAFGYPEGNEDHEDHEHDGEHEHEHEEEHHEHDSL